ncbi:MAG TPA: DUF2189 domain-containing protein [Gammaproteobacteria bacterium]|nr:DUF2189 domain-containing protein [Gammaproteobacteria bacterium]
MDQHTQRRIATPNSGIVREPAVSIVPPVRVVGLDAPWRWLKLGLEDFRAAGFASVFYGLVFACMGRLLSWVFSHAYEYVWALTSGFMLVGPFLALGLYDLSRRRGRGETPSLRPTLFAWRENLASLGLFGLVLGILLLLWSRASLVVIAVSFPDEMPSFEHFTRNLFAPEHLQFLLVYCSVGAVFASLVFATAVVSVPMMLDRDTDGIVAALTSLRNCAENAATMVLWAGIITALTALGFATWHLGLVLIVPVIGHATWHAYKEIVGYVGE